VPIYASSQEEPKHLEKETSVWHTRVTWKVFKMTDACVQPLELFKDLACGSAPGIKNASPRNSKCS
jgi:hypothetical protein